MTDSERDLGRIEGRLSALEDRIARHENNSAGRLDSIESKLDAVTSAIAQQQGGARLIYLVTTLAAGASGWLAHLFSNPAR